MIKNQRRGRELFHAFEFLLYGLARVAGLFPRWVRVPLFGSFRMTNGYIGLGIRYALLKSLAKEWGSNIAVHPGVYFFSVQNLEVGSNVTFHPMCYVDASGGLRIGRDVSIAHGTTILSSSHYYGQSGVPISDQGMYYKETVIEDNVWIGAKTTILAGVRIHSGAVIGANSVVNRDVASDIVVGGTPARRLKERVERNGMVNGVARHRRGGG